VSYSGETREIVDMLDFIKRIGVKLITITGSRSSRIARYSDIVLDARVATEAGPNGIVPTSSSTAALALGDALAIAVMKKKGFGERDFASVHPKGAIGKRLIRVETLMHNGRTGPAVSLETPMPAVIEEIAESTRRLALELGVRGLMNAQYAVKGDEVFVLEVNPRASRTIPFVSKAIGRPLAKLAALLMVGKTLDGLFYMLGEEEKKIRQNPAAQTTALLKEVFGRK
jgi:hypothetical protein